MEEHDKGPPIVKTSITIGQLERLLQMSLKRKLVGREDIILWARNVDEGSDLQYEMGYSPGTIVLGIQHEDNSYGVLRIEPSAVSKYLS